MKRISKLCAFLLCFCVGLQAQDIETKIENLLNKMTLEEKIGQMNLYNGFWNFTGPLPKEGESAKFEHLRNGLVGGMLNVRGVESVRKLQRVAVEETRLGIPLIFGFDLIHGYKTIFPIPLAEAASWDMNAIKNSARHSAVEATAAGLNWTFAPMVDISRDARWGRGMEGAGEDPYLGSKIAAARVKGFQGDDLSDPYTLVACAKHFAGYGFSESGKDYNSVDVGMSTLYNIILPPFKAALDAGAGTFMNGFNDLNGTPVTAHAFLQRDILKGHWGFDGFIVSDWGSISELIYHGQAQDGKEAAMRAANAGSDMDMESYLYLANLKELVEEKKVDIEHIDDAVRRILRIKFRLGLFDDPYRYLDEEREKAKTNTEEQQQAALEMAQKSIVLLKNENNLLPLKKEGLKIGLIGALADDKDSPLGNWRLAAEPHSAISLKEVIKDYASNEVEYVKGADVSIGETTFIKEVNINTSDKSGFAEAVRVAKSSDVVVMVLGENGFQSGEGRSRANIGLPGVQQELLETVYQANPNMVLVLMNGRPLALPWAAEHVPSMVEAWQLGTQSGHAIAKVLYGDYNPSGKLPVTFPRSVGQIPIYYNYKKTGRGKALPNDLVFWSHYMDEVNEPLYAFGHGLSYTEFAYTNLSVEKKGARSLEVRVTLVNKGGRTGIETVQLYIQDVYSSITRPVKELKGFQQVELKAGESRTLSFTLTEKELGMYNNQGEFFFEPGDYIIMVGGSSDKVLSKKVRL